MIGSKMPRNRKFNIEFQYYDPDKEEREGHRIKFERGRIGRKSARAMGLFWLMILAVMTFMAIRYLIGVSAGGG